jgi:hypothetical protein
MHRLPHKKTLTGKTIVNAVIWFVCAVAPVKAQQSPHGDFSQTCTDCHTTESWTKLKETMKFDHQKTSYPLYGQHRNTTCRSCHTNLHFTGTPRTCVECHMKDYDATITIDHRIAGLPLMCEQCHVETASAWSSSFDHNRTQFPIRGAHETVACITCHTNNRFRGISITCVSCHRTEYMNSKNPNHITAGFSTDCAMCHRALTWIPAAFYPHQWFPIASGDMHSPGRWKACTDCHAAQPNYSTFECINCHQHNKATTDSNHSNVRGYVYQSSLCYHCHPAGTR